MKSYDAIIIGAGQAGIPLAKKLGASGKSVALIEKRVIGGTCINDGCSPTKTMIASARIAYLTKNSSNWGVNTSEIKIDYAKVLQRKNDIVNSFRAGAEKGLAKEKKITVFFGEAAFESENSVSIKSKKKTIKLKAKQIFVNTGCSPAIPDIEGIAETPYLTSTSLLDLPEIPEHLVIIGGGYIALELGQMMRRFGAKVTILEQAKTLLNNEDDDVCIAFSEFLEKEGIKILTSSKATAISGTTKKHVKAFVNGKVKNIFCSHILLATGRKPQTEALKLHLAGVKTDEKGYIKVNSKLQTSVKNIYALGDVKGGPAFTNVAYNDFVILTHNQLKKENLSIKNRIVPYCMFTDPQLGRVGITEIQAKAQGIKYKVAKLPMKHVARALEIGEVNGFMKAIVDEKTDKILGVSIIGTEGGEIMSVLQMAMVGNLSYQTIRYQMFAHPLFSESLNNLFMSLDEEL